MAFQIGLTRRTHELLWGPRKELQKRRPKLARFARIHLGDVVELPLLNFECRLRSCYRNSWGVADMKNPALGGAFILPSMTKRYTKLAGSLPQSSDSALRQLGNLRDWCLRLGMGAKLFIVRLFPMSVFLLLRLLSHLILPVEARLYPEVN
jgi:hypothetical protein